MKLDNTLKGGLLVCLALLLISSNAGALLYSTFDESLKNDQIDLFWAGDANSPVNTGRTISNSPSAAIDASTPGKPDSTMPCQKYVFWSGDDAATANSQSTYFRIWDKSNRPIGSHYTGIIGDANNNPAGSPADKNYNVNYTYIKDYAGRAKISSVVESKTINDPTDPTPTVSGKVTFNSAQPLKNGFAIEIKEAEWQIDGATESTSVNMVKDASFFTMDRFYKIKVRHKSYWDNNWGEWSQELSYSFGGGGGASSFNFTLKPAQADKLIVNDIAIPSNNISYPEVATINKASELAGVINRKAGKTVVSAISRWNATTAKAEGVTFDGSGRVLSGIDFDLVPGYGVQVYTTEEIEITLQGQ